MKKASFLLLISAVCLGVVCTAYAGGDTAPKKRTSFSKNEWP